MAEQEISYDAIVRAEIAVGILNHARAIVTAENLIAPGDRA